LFRKRGFADADALPRVTAAIEVHARQALDLHDPAVLRALGVQPDDLLQEWEGEQESGREALTQALGRACYEAGIDCLLVPSARLSGQVNLVVFPQGLTKTGGTLVGRGLDPLLKP
jgi:RES domain-containing protein